MEGHHPHHGRDNSARPAPPAPPPSFPSSMPPSLHHPLLPSSSIAAYQPPVSRPFHPFFPPSLPPSSRLSASRRQSFPPSLLPQASLLPSFGPAPPPPPPQQAYPLQLPPSQQSRRFIAPSGHGRRPSRQEHIQLPSHVMPTSTPNPSLPPGHAAVPASNIVYGLNPATSLVPRSYSPQRPLAAAHGIIPTGLSHEAPELSFSSLRSQAPPLHHSNSYPTTSLPMMPPPTLGAPPPPPPPIASGPASHSASAPLRPMHSGSLMQQPLPTTLPQLVLGVNAAIVPLRTVASPPMTHVVGAQGRRKILPSEPGKMALDDEDGAAAKLQMDARAFEKDAHGKYPCPHCFKTYLHGKHLKRHLMRHTGDRPYMCPLCKDTFARSDILKRHFQKCACRRSSPLAAHLNHPQAHLSRSRSRLYPPLAIGAPQQMLVSPYGNAGMPPGSVATYEIKTIDGQTVYLAQAQPATEPDLASGSGGVKRPASSDGREGGNLCGPGSSGLSGNGLELARSLEGAPMLPSNVDPTGSSSSSALPTRSQSLVELVPKQEEPDDQPGLGLPLGAGSQDLGLPSRRSSQNLDLSGHCRRQTGIPFSGLSSTGPNGAWRPGFAPLSDQAFHNRSLDHVLRSCPPHAMMITQFGDPSSGAANGTQPHAIFSGLYPASSLVDDVPTASHFPNWQFDNSHAYPLQNKADQLLKFCVDNGTNDSMARPDVKALLRTCLSVANVDHFVKLFANFQGHWPVIHMPTFSFHEAYDGLLLAMVCIGAVYSDRLRDPELTVLITASKRSVYYTTRQMRGDFTNRPAPGTTAQPLVANRTGMEQMQALTLLQILITWHGDQVHREAARREFPGICEMARRAGFLKPAAMSHAAYSPLHQPGSTAEQLVTASSFDWRAWVEQEKRLRVIYNIYLLDTAMVVYFNTGPQFDNQELHIPLPADDVVWDAPTAADCARALGLNGANAQRSNLTGSRRRTQPEMRASVRALLSPGVAIEACSTNVYSKFILIHAIHVQIWKAQRQLSLLPDPPNTRHSRKSSDDFIPLAAQRDSGIVLNEDGPGLTGRPGSDRAPVFELGKITPANAEAQMEIITRALTKWKRMWDEDMIIQYPPTPSSPSGSSRRPGSRRFGFGRDGVPFYWLARAFLRNTQLMESHREPDRRLVLVLSLLRKVKQWVATDSANRGEPMGSVGDIDDKYGIDALTLDMKLFFTPMEGRPDARPSARRSNGPAQT